MFLSNNGRNNDVPPKLNLQAYVFFDILFFEEANMRKMKITFTAEFLIPDNVKIHDGGIFECEEVMFEPELSFNCVEVDINNPEELIQFPNDIWSLSQYEIKHLSVDSEIEVEEIED